MRECRLPALLAVLVLGAAPASKLPPLPETQRLLADRVTLVRAADGLPAASTVDYARIAGFPDGREQLARARAELLAVPPAKLDARARRAWAIDLYNVLVIDAVVRYGFAGGAAPAGVKDIQIDGHGFFAAPLATIAGHSWSLDALEKHYLFDDFDRAKGSAPPATLDPRIHFAIVCGARGCPPLLDEPYRPETLDAQLDRATRGALSGSKHLRWGGDPPSLQASGIFDWYAADFGGPAGALRFLTAHAPAATAKAIVNAKLEKIPAFIEWDWALNQTVATGR
jgi:hypothetical protein